MRHRSPLTRPGPTRGGTIACATVLRKGKPWSVRHRKEGSFASYILMRCGPLRRSPGHSSQTVIAQPIFEALRHQAGAPGQVLVLDVVSGALKRYRYPIRDVFRCFRREFPHVAVCKLIQAKEMGLSNVHELMHKYGQELWWDVCHIAPDKNDATDSQTTRIGPRKVTKPANLGPEWRARCEGQEAPSA